MYLILLAFGAVLTAAGIVLAAAGISLRDHAFDAGIFTPGIVAAVGGLLLFGLGLALRVLQRIEEAIAVRPMPRAARPGEADPAASLSSEPAVLPLPPKATVRPVLASATAAKLPVGNERRADVAEKSPVLAHFENAEITEESEISLAPRSSSALAASRVDQAVAEADKVRAARRKNGAAAGRTAPRLDLNTRFGSAPEDRKGPTFDALWPKGSRPLRTTQAAPVRSAPPVEIEPPSPEPSFEAEEPIAARRRVRRRVRRGHRPQIRRRRRNGLYALFGRIDRSGAAAGHAAVRLHYRTAQSHRAGVLGLRCSRRCPSRRDKTGIYSFEY